MLRKIKKEDIKIGTHILRKDIVKFVWLEDRIYYQEKVDWFLENWDNLDKDEFQIIL